MQIDELKAVVARLDPNPSNWTYREASKGGWKSTIAFNPHKNIGLGQDVGWHCVHRVDNVRTMDEACHAYFHGFATQEAA